ncbi:MAG: sugar phosphate nucleotidyltransferase [Bacteroidales bacterium]
MISGRKSAMILAAGMGTRLGELTQSTPKALIEINGIPLLQIIIEKLKKHDFNHLIINVFHHKDQIIEFLNNHSDFEIEICISDESEQLLDTGGALLKAYPFFKNSEVLLVHNVDILTDIDLKSIYQNFSVSRSDALLICRERKSSRKFLIDNQNRLSGWKNTLSGEIKWVTGKENSHNEVSFSGIHLFKPELLAGIEISKCSVIDIYLRLAKTKQIECLISNSGYWFDLGKKEHISEISNIVKHL